MSSSDTKRTMSVRCVVLWIFSVLISVGSSNSTFRRHKVHNIVLYPDRHSWCTSTPIKQVVSDVGCEPAEIDNRVCLGACFSYSIPRTLPADNADEIDSYCDSCQPVNMSWVPVNLTCGDGSNRTKHVQLIKECRCSSCSRHWEFENPSTNGAVDEDKVEVSTQAPRYMELMKLEHDENAAEGDESNAATASGPEILDDIVNSTKLAYVKNIWIRGPHHSKVLYRKEMTSNPNIAQDNAQERSEDIAEKNKL